MFFDSLPHPLYDFDASTTVPIPRVFFSEIRFRDIFRGITIPERIKKINA